MELPDRFPLLTVDDEVDMPTLTRLTLKSLRYLGRPLEFLSAHTGGEAVSTARASALPCWVPPPIWRDLW